MFQYEIVSAFPDQDIHITQLNEFQYGKEQEYSVYPVFADFNDILKWNRFITTDYVNQILPAFFYGIGVLNNGMSWLVVALLQAH